MCTLAAECSRHRTRRTEAESLFKNLKMTDGFIHFFFLFEIRIMFQMIIKKTGRE